MKYLSFCIVASSLFVTADLSAQKNKVESISWNISGQLPASNGKLLGFAGPVVGVNNDVLLVGGGANFPDDMPWNGGKKKYYDDLYVFKKDHRDSLVLFQSHKLPLSLAYAACISTGKGLVVAGGENDEGISNKVFLIQWDDHDQNLRVINLPDLPRAVTNASVTVNNDKVYLVGGETIDDVSKTFLLLDLKKTVPTWQQLPSFPKPISHAAMVVQHNEKNDCIYVIGGRKRNIGSTSDLYASTFQFDLKQRKWKEKAALPSPLAAGTGVAFGDDNIILFGGDNGETFHRTEKLIAAIATEKDEAKKALLIREKAGVQSNHPGFSKAVLKYNTLKDQWTIIKYIPYESPVTTTAVKWNDLIIIPGGEIRAGVRTSQIISAKIFYK
ncbi:kelch repeat-containing protein [Chitinophagaceae bacterium 26-R-25]|nr:kelch repeat-containing protein [Chitinophagaceae bacterium 26-R-25]